MPKFGNEEQLSGAKEPSTNTAVFRVSLFLHRWTGLLAFPFFLVLVVSGSILIFSEEIDQLLGDVPAGTRAESANAGGERKSLDELSRSALAESPGKRLIYLYYEKDRLDRVTVRVDEPGYQEEDHGTDVIVDSVTGLPLSSIDPDKTFAGWILNLHKEWFLGRLGEIFGAVVAALVLVSLLSGLLIYAPYARKAFWGLIRWKRGARSVQLDLHCVIGVVVLGWAIVVTITGMFLGLAGVSYDYWKTTALKPVIAKIPADATGFDYRNPPVSPDEAMEVVQKRFPDWRFDWILWPLTDYSTPRHYAIWMGGPEGAREHLFETAYVDAVSGELVGTVGFPWYLKLMFVSEPLHFGDYGGLPLKIFWVTNAWMTLFITANGAWLWWDRKRRQSLTQNLRRST